LRLVLIFLSFFISLNTFAQQQNTVDSLLNLLSQNIPDTSRANTLNQLSRFYKLNDVSASHDYAQQSLELSLKIDYCKGISSSYINIANSCFYKGLYAQAISNYREAFFASKKCKDVDAAGSAFAGLAIGEMYQGNYDKAIEYNLSALKIKEFTQSKRGVADIYNNIAELNRYLKNYEKAILFNKLSLELEKELNNTQGIADSYHNIAGVYFSQGKYDEAKEWYEKSVEKKIETDDKRGLSSTYGNLGIIYEVQQQFKKADFYYRLSYELREGLEDRNGLIRLGFSFGRLHKSSKKFDEAEKSYLTALQIAREIGAKESIKEAYLNLYELKKAQNKHQEALNYLESFGYLKDSIYNENILKKVTEIESEYLVEKQAKEIALLQKDKIAHELEDQINLERRNYLYLSFFILLVGGVELVRRYNKKRNLNQFLEITVKERTAKLEAKNKEVELMLKEIHHRVKNNMQLITSLLKLQLHYHPEIKPEEIVEQVSQKIKCMAMIHDRLFKTEDFTNFSTQPYFEKLVKFIQEVEGRLEITIHSEFEEHHLSIDEMIPCGLIINELLSNVFKHGFKDTESGDVWVKFHCIGNAYTLSVRDNGKGIPEGTDFNNSLGLSLVQDLAQQLNGNAEITNTANGGAEIKVVFPGKA
jgi:two-component system, sensor histidine kinase PdtaS